MPKIELTKGEVKSLVRMFTEVKESMNNRSDSRDKAIGELMHTIGEAVLADPNASEELKAEVTAQLEGSFRYVVPRFLDKLVAAQNQEVE